MKQLRRFLMIFSFFIVSTIIIHTMKAPERVPFQGFRVACITATDAATTNADKNLIPYAQIAHTTSDKPENLRCYFRLPNSYIACIPKSVAQRQPHVSSCPQFPTIDGTPDKLCYLLNKKYVPFIELLQKKPAVTADAYITNKKVIVKTWQQVRDILLGQE